MELMCADETGFRSVNDIETDALKFTFGEEVGNWLIGTIKIKIDPDLLRRGYFAVVEDRVNGEFNQTQMKLRPDYSVENLWWLGVFIHEASHIWQRNTGCNRTGETDYRYTRSQLPTLRLGKEEHASAVQHWFYVKYGIENRLIGAPYQVDRFWVWRQVSFAFGYNEKNAPCVNLGFDALQKIITAWDPVIEDIRDPAHMEDSICNRAEVPYPAGLGW